MKGNFTVLVCFVVMLVSCKESGIPVATPSTFTHYYNNFGDQLDAQAILEISDGFMILANSSSHGPVLIRTDKFGNLQPSATPDKLFSKNWYAGGFTTLKDNSGYMMVGRSGTKMILFKADVDGKPTGDSAVYNLKGKNNEILDVDGLAIVQGQTSGDFFVVGKISNYSDDMLLARVLGTKLDSVVFYKTYGAGGSTLANRIYLDYTEQNAYWGGTRTDANGIHMRFVKSGFISNSTYFDITYPIGQLGDKFYGNDFCAYGYGFAFVGSHVAASGLYDSISFTRVGGDGDVQINVKNYGLVNPASPTTTFEQSAKPGNSICSTQDGGTLILGTLAMDAQGTDTDYFLIKLDGTGKQQWSRTHGGKYLDKGVRVLQAADGGYIVLGTTTLANVNTVFLMKTDTHGDIQ
ncbi:MAG: hypothetical protein JSS79_20165 [Bacteroidetes bacterium]|nr:hypothetical protein [Bacteroidota bacterium]